jgi:hypothetical protein
VGITKLFQPMEAVHGGQCPPYAKERLQCWGFVLNFDHWNLFDIWYLYFVIKK